MNDADIASRLEAADQYRGKKNNFDVWVESAQQKEVDTFYAYLRMLAVKVDIEHLYT